MSTPSPVGSLELLLSSSLNGVFFARHDTLRESLMSLTTLRASRRLDLAVHAAASTILSSRGWTADYYHFGPLMLLADRTQPDALPVPTQRCLKYHPARHHGAHPLNGARLLAALWTSPEWLRFWMVRTTREGRWSVGRLEPAEGAAAWVTCVTVVAPLMVQLCRLPSCGVRGHVQLAALVAACCLMLVLVAPLNSRWVQRTVTPNLLRLVSLSIGLPAAIRLVSVVADVLWTEHWSIGWQLGMAAFGAVMSVLWIIYDSVPELIRRRDLWGLPIFIGICAVGCSFGSPLLVSARVWVAVIPVVVGLAAYLGPHRHTHNEPHTVRSLPLICPRYLWTGQYPVSSLLHTPSDARPILRLVAGCVMIVVAIELGIEIN